MDSHSHWRSFIPSSSRQIIDKSQLKRTWCSQVSWRFNFWKFPLDNDTIISGFKHFWYLNLIFLAKSTLPGFSWSPHSCSNSSWLRLQLLLGRLPFPCSLKSLVFPPKTFLEFRKCLLVSQLRAHITCDDHIIRRRSKAAFIFSRYDGS